MRVQNVGTSRRNNAFPFIVRVIPDDASTTISNSEASCLANKSQCSAVAFGNSVILHSVTKNVIAYTYKMHCCVCNFRQFGRNTFPGCKINGKIGVLCRRGEHFVCKQSRHTVKSTQPPRTDAEKAEVFRPHSMVSKPQPARASRWRAMRFSSSESEGSIVAQ